MSKNNDPRLANFFGASGYFWMALQWLWTVIVVGYPLLGADISWLVPKSAGPAPAPVAISMPEPILFIFVGIVVVTSIAITIYALVMLPKNIAKSGSKASSKTVEALIPIITKNKTLPKKKRRLLSARIKLYFKLFAIVLPLALVLFFNNSTLGNDVVRIVSITLADLSAVNFIVQYATAKLTKKDFSLLW